MKEALCACLCFTAIGLFNVGLHWGERSSIVEQVTWELQSQLTLSESQTAQVLKINYEFYDDALAMHGRRNTEHKIFQEWINHLVMVKNKKIMKILNTEQQMKWHQNYLVSTENKQ